MNGNVALALLILGYLIAFCFYLVADVNKQCEEQQEQDAVELRRRNAEAVQATGAAE